MFSNTSDLPTLLLTRPGRLAPTLGHFRPITGAQNQDLAQLLTSVIRSLQPLSLPRPHDSGLRLVIL